MFGAADEAANRGSCYNVRICEIGVAFSHAARHIAVCGGNGYLSLLRTTRTCVNTGTAARLFNHMNACRKQHLVDATPLGIFAHALRAVLDEGWNADFPSAKDFRIHQY